MYAVVRAGVALCVAALTACSSSQQPPALSSPVAPQPQAEVTTTALTVSAVNPPIRLFGSDGKTHIEYDLILQSIVQCARDGDLDRGART